MGTGGAHVAFTGEARIEVTCEKCNVSRYQVESFTDLQLHVPEKTNSEGENRGVVTVEQLVADWHRTEHLTGLECDSCQTRAGAHRRSEIQSSPDCLVLTLLRFSAGSTLKNGTRVSFPRKLDLPLAPKAAAAELGTIGGAKNGVMAGLDGAINGCDHDGDAVMGDASWDAKEREGGGVTQGVVDNVTGVPSAEYNLYACVDHAGSTTTSGHYTCRGGR